MATKDNLSKLANLSSGKQALLERMPKRSTLSVAPAIRRRTSHESAPLSFAQQRLWLIQQLGPNSYLYNVPPALQIKGHLDVIILEKALNSIIQRHEVLRTTFPADENGQPGQNLPGTYAESWGRSFRRCGLSITLKPPRAGWMNDWRQCRFDQVGTAN